MKHVGVGVLLLVAASGPVAEAQQRADNAGPVLASADDLGIDLRPASAARLVQQPPQRPTPPPPPPPRPRRRGSMVGYIEDPIVESKIRVRFDAAFENSVPDRAEFFYAKCGCFALVNPLDPSFDPDAPGPRGAADDLDFQQLYIGGEYAFSSRFSAFGQLPFRWIQPQGFLAATGSFADAGGVEDIRAGIKVGLVASEDQAVTGQVRLFFPTGDSERGLGTNHSSIEPAVLYYQRVNDLVAIESQAGFWVPLDGATPVPTQADGTFAGDVFFYGIGPSFSVYQTDRVRFAPVVELVGWRVLNGNQTAATTDASGTNIVNLKLGARTVFQQGSFYVGYGFALTDQKWYDDVLRFEYRYEF
jgi:hypothetical protein